MEQDVTQYKPKKFMKKPVEIEAYQFTDWASALGIFRWATDVFYVPRGYDHDLRQEGEKDRSRGDTLEDAAPFLVVKTLEGYMRADVRDWIIRGVNGEYYPCKPDIFKATYDDVEED